MKELKYLCLNYFNEIDPDQIVETVYNRGTIERLTFPRKASDVSCPMCGGEKGFFIPIEKCWSCMSNYCINENAFPGCGGIYPPDWQNDPRWRVYPKSSGRPPLSDFDIPIAFYGVSPNQWLGDPLLDQFIEYCRTFHGFLLLTGGSGRGKTHAACCVIRAYTLKKRGARFVNVADLYVSWLSLRQSGESDLGLINKYTEFELLVLDDLGTRTPSEGFLDFLYVIINARTNNPECGTVITTNMNSQEMIKKVGNAITSRVASGQIIKFEGRDRRQVTF